VPTGATTGNVVVIVGGIASNGVQFTVNTATSVKLIQHAGTDAGTATSASRSFTSSNTAGNFIAVVIRAGKSGQVFSVSDSRGKYIPKGGQLQHDRGSQYHGYLLRGEHAGGANTVTVSDTISALYDLRFEYSGVAGSSSLDATAVSEGNSASPNSGNAFPSLSG